MLTVDLTLTTDVGYEYSVVKALETVSGAKDSFVIGSCLVKTKIQAETICKLDSILEHDIKNLYRLRDVVAGDIMDGRHCITEKLFTA